MPIVYGIHCLSVSLYYPVIVCDYLICTQPYSKRNQSDQQWAKWASASRIVFCPSDKHLNQKGNIPGYII